MPESEARTDLLKLVNEGVTDIKKLRTKAPMWRTGVMDILRQIKGDPTKPAKPAEK